MNLREIEAKAKVLVAKVRPHRPIKINVYGARDPRGPDNNILIWLDEDDCLHILVWKAERCYKFETVLETDSFVEVIQA